MPAARTPASFHVPIPVLRVVFAEKSFFDTAQSTLRPEAYPILRAIAETLKGDVPDTAVFVAGHTDSRGSEDYNYNLSVSRSDAVAQALYHQGVGQIALWRVGFGEAVPLYPNDSDEHMGYNRRVEFLFAARTEAVLDTLKRQLDHVCAASDAAAADKCKRSIELRPSFEAVQLTARETHLDLDTAAPTSIGGARARAAVAGAKPRVSASLAGSKAAVGGAKPMRTAQVGARVIAISLNAEMKKLGNLR